MRLLVLALALTTATAIPSPKHAHFHRSVHVDSQGLEPIAVRDVVTVTTTIDAPDTSCSSSVQLEATGTASLRMPDAYALPQGWIPPSGLSISLEIASTGTDAALAPYVPSTSTAAPTSDEVTSIPAESAPTSVNEPSDSSPEPVEAPSAYSKMGQTSSTAVLAATSVTSAAPQSTSVKPSTSIKTSAPASSPISATNTGFPFSNMVIFGDNLSDRGNGSSDHQVAGNPETIYGFKTWTNGPIAAEVLANGLKVPIKYDYAYGHAAGGSKFGATVDNHFTQSDAGAPSCAEQIANYTSNGNYYSKDTIAKTMHFVWSGNNDVLPWALPSAQSSVKVNQSHIFFGSGADSGNQQFATTLATLITNQARTLIAAGAEHIFVPSVYPRHIAPVVAAYFGLDAPSVTQYGQVIQNTNTQVKQILSTLKTKGGRTPIYYDAFGFLTNLYNGAKTSQASGIKYVAMPGKDICDGATGQAVSGVSNWDLCQVQHHADEFFWMQFLDPTAKVHALLAADMQQAIQAAYKS